MAASRPQMGMARDGASGGPTDGASGARDRRQGGRMIGAKRGAKGKKHYLMEQNRDITPLLELNVLVREQFN